MPKTFSEVKHNIMNNLFLIGEPITDNMGSFAEGLIYARRLVLASKMGIEVVLKQPTLKDLSHPKSVREPLGCKK